jgi:hypothetical protein
VRGAGGWQIDGEAVFLHAGVPAVLRYSVACDADFVSNAGRVRGWVGEETLELTLDSPRPGRWTLNGEHESAVDGCVDLDLGFTPATNLLPLRRLSLSIGKSARITSAWLDIATGRLEPLVQVYDRRTEDSYWYEAPRFGYAASLEVTPEGFVRLYPALWQMEPGAVR